MDENGTPNQFLGYFLLVLLAQNGPFYLASAPGGVILGELLDLSWLCFLHLGVCAGRSLWYLPAVNILLIS